MPCSEHHHQGVFAMPLRASEHMAMEPSAMREDRRTATEVMAEIEDLARQSRQPDESMAEAVVRVCRANPTLYAAFDRAQRRRQ